MRFPPDFLEQIRARVNLSSVVGRHVQWDRRKTQAAKGDYWACCPFHTEKSPSFHADDRKGRYHCFGCKASGDIFTFLVEKEGLNFPEAVERLASDAGLPMPVISAAEVEREKTRASLYDIMEISAKLFQSELQSSHGAKARGYLSDRDLSPAIQKEFGIGYARDDRSWLRNELAAKGIALEQMIEAGLVVVNEDNSVGYDRFRDRVMFPIRDQRGRVIAFGGRALRPDVPAKYLNSPETPIFHKGDVLYNFDKARTVAHGKARLIAVEGYVDVIAMHRAGFVEAVAPLGTALTENQLSLLWRTVPEPILCFDGDAAGLKAAYRALDLALPLLAPGHTLRFAFLPEGKDPDDLLRAEGAAAVQAVIAAAEPMADVLWRRALAENDRAGPERRAAFERDVRALIGGIKDETVRRHYLDDLRERLQGLWNSGRAPATGASRGGALRTYAPRLKPGQKAWEVPMPASPQLRAAANANTAASAAERRERMILLSAINHPEILHDFWDDFAALEITTRALDSLRTLILDVASSEEALDREALKTHLSSRGFGPDLGRLEDQAKRLNEWFLGPLAAPDDARTGLRQMIALHRKTVTLDRELKAAEAAFARDPSEDNQAALFAVRDQLLSAHGAEAQIEGFGAASGRGQSEGL
jgi:DNA primase